jgi:hypothetical protein
VLSALRLETTMFMNEKVKFAAEIGGERWLWDLALLCYISHHPNDFKCNRNSFSDVSGVVRGFETK